MADQAADKPLSKALRIAAGYMILSGVIGLLFGVIGLIWPNLNPNFQQFQPKSFAYKLGAEMRVLTIAAAYVAAGTGLFRQLAWARKFALVTLFVATIYGTNDFAWGFMRGAPSLRVYLVSAIITTSWNAIWFFIIYREKSNWPTTGMSHQSSSTG